MNEFKQHYIENLQSYQTQSVKLGNVVLLFMMIILLCLDRRLGKMENLSSEMVKLTTITADMSFEIGDKAQPPHEPSRQADLGTHIKIDGVVKCGKMFKRATRIDFYSYCAFILNLIEVLQNTSLIFSCM